jgi:hypothetical protein
MGQNKYNVIEWYILQYSPVLGRHKIISLLTCDCKINYHLQYHQTWYILKGLNNLFNMTDLLLQQIEL